MVTNGQTQAYRYFCWISVCISACAHAGYFRALNAPGRWLARTGMSQHWKPYKCILKFWSLINRINLISIFYWFYQFAAMRHFLSLLLVIIGLHVSTQSIGRRSERSASRYYRSVMTVPNGMWFGSWGEVEMCPRGTYAAGFSLKVSHDWIMVIWRFLSD